MLKVAKIAQWKRASEDMIAGWGGPGGSAVERCRIALLLGNIEHVDALATRHVHVEVARVDRVEIEGQVGRHADAARRVTSREVLPVERQLLHGRRHVGRHDVGHETLHLTGHLRVAVLRHAHQPDRRHRQLRLRHARLRWLVRGGTRPAHVHHVRCRQHGRHLLRLAGRLAAEVVLLLRRAHTCR